MTQFLTPLTEPLGLIWFVMAIAVSWLLYRRQWRIAIWLGVPTLLMFIAGSTPLAEVLVVSAESTYAAQDSEQSGRSNGTTNAGEAVRGRFADLPPADAVVALGGGQRVSRYDPLGFGMVEGGSRLLTAIEVVRAGKAKTLVLGGSWPVNGEKGAVPSMAVVQDWVTSWELVNGVVTNLGVCINTHDEAIAFKKLKEVHGWQTTILVTSALHMRRSEALFRKQGIRVTPVAADFQAYGVFQGLPFSPFPRLRRFYLLSIYLHEQIGCCVYRLRGWM